ncbi:methyltransferase domain-containing protein [uncultured Pseudomonas sp.]|uniref:methyltransferase domain-containing protein n=1 Tax=uncultured Pseudomonas sp. TaxID=114707 RepID=UPI00258F3E03|nr:methyltransferase domain-containing protein [uncultured Pseudomonas sp.]
MSDTFFDDRATRFAANIYGGTKGAIRLAVLQADLAEVLPQRPLRVLDIGAGLGHMSLWLARQGHAVTLAEPSAPMLAGAQEAFATAGLSADWLALPWQELPRFAEPFDLVLCHAVLEWLETPTAILPTLHRCLAPDGWLSLAFYNRDALIYRNLLKGHFRKLRQGEYAGAGQRGLTPQQPLDPREVEAWLAPDWRIQARSGVRVFHDYMPPEFQARAAGEELVAMELAHRRHPAFAGLGRYLHWLCQAKAG